MKNNNWQEKKLGNIATFINGKAFKPSDWSDTGLPIIRIQNLTNSIDDIHYYNGDIEEKYRITTGDILISWSATIGVFEWLNGDAVLNQHIFKVVFDKEPIDKTFFKHLIKQKIDEMLKNVHGSTMKHITKGDFDNIDVLLPSLDEQKKIAKILDKADEIRAKKKLANDKLDEFLKSTYIDLFAENTKKVKLEELCYFITKGTTPKAQDMSQDSGDIPYIKVYNLRFDTRLDFTINPTFVTKESHKNFLARSVVYPGDVLMNIVGPPLCKVSIVPDTYPEWNINQAIARFRCNKGLNNLYLAWFLTTPFAEKQMLRNAKKTSGQLNLTLEICKNIEIPLPSLELQNKFAKIVEKVEAQKQKNELVIEQMNNLFNSLSQRAFKGEI